MLCSLLDALPGNRAWLGIDFCTFSWDAFATLVTGAAALFAAWRFGSRQIELQRRQAELEHFSVKVQLFERRLRVFEAVFDILGEVVARAVAPTAEKEGMMLLNTRDARFLYGQDIIELIDETGLRTVHLRSTEAAIDDHRRHGEDVPDKIMARYMDELEWFHTQFHGLRPRFEPYLSLSSLEALGPNARAS